MNLLGHKTRRCSLLVVMALYYMVQVTQGLVIGIDFGVDSFKVVLVRPGSIDIVLNEGSSRKTHSAIGFSAHGRVYGEQATQLYTKNPSLVFNSMTSVLGRNAINIDDAWLQDLHQGDHHMFWLQNVTLAEEVSISESEDPSRKVLVRVGEETVFIEEILAQLLAKAKQYATAEAGSAVKDCTITVPFYWSHSQRQALLDAAQLAGLNVLSLVNQNMAIAIKFLTDRDFEDGPKHVVFYDMGTSDLQVSLYRFESTKGKGKTKWVNNATLLATFADPSLGGSTFDNILVEMWKEQLKHKLGPKYPTQLPPQAITKLLKQAKKTKEMLSANKESQVAIESLLPDYDFRSTITREQFELACQPLFERVLAPLKSVLEVASITPQQIDFFEMFGGGARIPKIQDVLKSYLDPIPLSRHLNSDEGAAFGAAIYAASKSSQHRVKEFNIKDGANAHYPILVRAVDHLGNSLVDSSDGDIDTGATSNPLDHLLYRENSRLGSKRTLKIMTDKDIFVEVKYAPTVELPEGIPHLIGKYQVSFPEDMYTRYNVTGIPTANIRFELTTSGTLVLSSAEAQVPTIHQKVVKIKVEKEAEKEESKEDTQDENSEHDSSESAATSDQTSSESSESESSEASNQNVENSEDVATEPVYEERTEIKEVKTNMKLKLHVNSLVHIGLTPGEVTKALQRITHLDEEEKIRLDTEKAKSDLEALIYAIYDKVDDATFQKFSTEPERSAMIESCSVESNWLEEEGADASKAEYIERKAALSKTWDKINTRISESTDLPKSVEDCLAIITLSREAVAKIEQTRNVTEADITPVLDSIQRVEDFVINALETETKRDPAEDPITLSTRIDQRCKEFSWRIELLSKRPKRKIVVPEAEKPIEEKPSESTDQEQSTTYEASNEEVPHPQHQEEL